MWARWQIGSRQVNFFLLLLAFLRQNIAPYILDLTAAENKSRETRFGRRHFYFILVSRNYSSFLHGKIETCFFLSFLSHVYPIKLITTLLNFALWKCLENGSDEQRHDQTWFEPRCLLRPCDDFGETGDWCGDVRRPGSHNVGPWISSYIIRNEMSLNHIGLQQTNHKYFKKLSNIRF